MVWISCKVFAEDNLPYLPHTNEDIGAYVTTGARIHLYSFSTGCKRTRTIVTMVPLYLFSRVSNPGLSQQGTSWGHAIRTTFFRTNNRVSVRWTKKLYIQTDHQGRGGVSLKNITPQNCEFRGNKGHVFLAGRTQY